MTALNCPTGSLVLPPPAQKELNECIREKTFEMAVKHNVDLIFTYVCTFDEPEEKTYLTQLKDLFEHNGGRFFFVELFADIETRLARNETPHRMERKPSKRDGKRQNHHVNTEQIMSEI